MCCCYVYSKWRGPAGAEAARTKVIISCMGKRSGGADRDRTDDLLHAMQALFQLSYGPTLLLKTI